MSEKTLSCPLCDYNVQGLPEPRCPECGHVFEWAELTDPARMKLAWLFEHRPGPKSYATTALRLCIPWKFWRELRPSHAVRTPRLVLGFLVGVLLLALVAILLPLFDAAISTNRRNHQVRRYYAAPATPTQVGYLSMAQRQRLPSNPTLGDVTAMDANMSTKVYLEREFPIAGDAGFGTLAWQSYTPKSLLRMTLPSLAIPFATLLVLSIMRESFARVKMKREHLLRVALYSGDLLMAAVGIFTVWSLRVVAGVGGEWEPPAVVLFVALLLALRLETGVRKYLGIPRAWAVTITTLGIGALSAGVLWSWLGILWKGY